MATTSYGEALTATWARPRGALAFLFDTSHKSIGTRFIVTALGFMLLSGLDSLAIRAQLAFPENDLIDPQTFSQLFTTHGSAMMYLFAVPIVEGLATYLVPLMIGARDLPFPRLNVFGYYLYLFGGLLLYAPTLADIGNFFLPGDPLPRWIPDTGWFAYPPLSGAEFTPGPSQDIWLISLTLAEVAAIFAAIELLVVILKCRAPGMGLTRMPLFVWSVLGMAVAIILAFPSLLVSSALLEVQRVFDLPFYEAARGGDPVLWQHLFWIFGHPEVYIMFLPATGVISMVIPVFVRRPIIGYALIAFSIMATAILSTGLWVHHMFTVGLPWLGLTLFSAASMLIAVPSGIQVFAWLVTLIRGRRLQLTTPMLFSLGFIVTFVLGGLTGVMVASVPFDLQVHDTYFVVAHFHYVLVGGVLFPVFAAIYHWFPKVTGRLLDDRIGRLSFWLQVIGFNMAFLPQHAIGLLGMPRRVWTYPPDSELAWMNLASSIGAFVMAAGIALIALDMALAARRSSAPADPWSGFSLEWATGSPPAPYSFATVPIVRGREPLWEADQLAWAPEPPQEVIEAPGGLWRETLGTDPVRARPTDVIWLPSGTPIPLVAAIAIVIASLALLPRWYLVSGLAALVALVLGIAWLWPRRPQLSTLPAGRTLGGFEAPVHVVGPDATPWWGLVAGLAATGFAYLALGFASIYLAALEPAWPPPHVSLPGPLVQLAAGAVAVLAAASAWLALRDGRRGAAGARVAGRLALTGILGLIAIVVHAALLVSGPDPTGHAQAAIRATLLVSQSLMVGIGVVAALVVGVQARLGVFDAQRYQAVDHVALGWAFLAVTGIATGGLLLLPAVVS